MRPGLISLISLRCLCPHKHFPADITHKVIHDPLSFVKKIFMSNFSKLTETWMDGAEMLKGLRVAQIMAHTWDRLIKISIYFVYIGFNNNYTSWLGCGVGGQIVACLLSSVRTLSTEGPSPSSSISSLEPGPWTFQSAYCHALSRG